MAPLSCHKGVSLAADVWSWIEEGAAWRAFSWLPIQTFHLPTYNGHLLERFRQPSLKKLAAVLRIS